MDELLADLLKKIKDGAYPPGSAALRAGSLAAEYDVSQSTISRAVARLREQGVLVGRPGRGVFVAESPPCMISQNLRPHPLRNLHLTRRRRSRGFSWQGIGRGLLPDAHCGPLVISLPLAPARPTLACSPLGQRTRYLGTRVW